MGKHRLTSRRRQRGAVIITVALVLLFLLGFMAIALDFGRLFVVKTELQTAMDSCALAAAQELDGKADALPNAAGEGRATNAGMTAGNLNKVHFQAASAEIVPADVTFSDTLNGSYSHTFTPVENAKYAKCAHTKSGMAPWLLQAMTAFSGNAAYSATLGVQALGIAARRPAQTNCALPIAICEKAGGYQPGEWLSGAVSSTGAVTGQFRWVDFQEKGGGNAELKDMLKGEGQCQLPGNDTHVKAGNNGGAAQAYNTRFGIYLGIGKLPPQLPGDGVPDQTGYAWYLDAAPAQPPYPNKYSEYPAKRKINAPYQGDDTSPDTVGLKTNGLIFDSLATAGASMRRVVQVPVVDCAAFDKIGGGTIKISSLACMFLLHPIKQGAAGNTEKMWLEYIDPASDIDSPCASPGLAGGTGGPLVPVLVQ